MENFMKLMRKRTNPLTKRKLPDDLEIGIFLHTSRVDTWRLDAKLRDIFPDGNFRIQVSPLPL